MIGTALFLMMAQPVTAAPAAPAPAPATAPRGRGRPPAAIAPQPPIESGAANPLPANPLPAGPRPRRAPRAVDPDQAAVMAPINAMLRALETNDGAAILANTFSGGGATVALEGENGQRRVRHLSWADFAGGLRADGNRYSEHIYAPRVMIDGDIAMVWARYIVRRNRQVQHCGYDHFDLVRDAGQWKVVNVTWSQRITGCGASPRRRGQAG